MVYSPNACYMHGGAICVKINVNPFSVIYVNIKQYLYKEISVYIYIHNFYISTVILEGNGHFKSCTLDVHEC